jgi:hypothetical protein
MPTKPESDPKRFQCRHVHANGRRCGSPALRNEHFCYYHHATRRPAPKSNAPRYPDADRHPFALPAVEDRSSLQLALNFVLGRIASNDLDPKRAGLLLYGLQIAVCALPREPRSAASAAVCEYGHACVPSSGTHPNPNPANDFQDDIALDPELGPLAPIAELLPPKPEDRPMSSVGRILDSMLRGGPFCPLCNPDPILKPTPLGGPADPPPFDLSTLPTIQAVAEPPDGAAPNPRVPHPNTRGPHISLLRCGFSRRHIITQHPKQSGRAKRLARSPLHPKPYFVATNFSTPAFRAAALSVASQVKSLPARPKCPYAAVAL